MERAYQGVKKLFISEIIGLIIVFLGVVVLVIAALPFEQPAALTAALALFATLLLIGSLVAFIVKIVGLNEGKEKSQWLGVAFWLVIAVIVLTLVSTVISFLKGSGLILNIIEAIVGVLNVAVVYFTFYGIAMLADEVGDKKMMQQGKVLAFIGVALYALSIILTALSKFVNVDVEPVKTIMSVLGIAGGVAELLTYILGIYYLGKATKMLKGK